MRSPGSLNTSVPSALDAWLDVQRAWCALEAIFVGSEDIREQLPEDAKRFDAVDADFKEQMVESNPNPLAACLADGRIEAMVKCQGGLELCQRSLADYLETKRKKFPRFYFVSAADLIDILSQGKYPPAVQEHFYKFTDNIGAIQWGADDDGKLTGIANGMVSGDKETVPFGRPHECRGAVEDWLRTLMAHCQRAGWSSWTRRTVDRSISTSSTSALRGSDQPHRPQQPMPALRWKLPGNTTGAPGSWPA